MPKGNSSLRIPPNTHKRPTVENLQGKSKRIQTKSACVKTPKSHSTRNSLKDPLCTNKKNAQNVPRALQWLIQQREKGVTKQRIPATTSLRMMPMMKKSTKMRSKHPGSPGPHPKKEQHSKRPRRRWLWWRRNLATGH